MCGKQEGLHCDVWQWRGLRSACDTIDIVAWLAMRVWAQPAQPAPVRMTEALARREPRKRRLSQEAAIHIHTTTTMTTDTYARRGESKHVPSGERFRLRPAPDCFRLSPKTYSF